MENAAGQGSGRNVVGVDVGHVVPGGAAECRYEGLVQVLSCVEEGRTEAHDVVDRVGARQGYLGLDAEGAGGAQRGATGGGGDCHEFREVVRPVRIVSQGASHAPQVHFGSGFGVEARHAQRGRGIREPEVSVGCRRIAYFRWHRSGSSPERTELWSVKALVADATRVRTAAGDEFSYAPAGVATLYLAGGHALASR